MNITARTATAKDFEKSAQSKANLTWVWGILAAVIYSYFDWWALIPAMFCIVTILQSITATLAADKLRKGTYRIPNLNNGAPDGDYKNYGANND